MRGVRPSTVTVPDRLSLGTQVEREAVPEPLRRWRSKRAVR